MGERLIIRSYRRVFDVDRRLYRVDRWALPVPGGVPLRGLGYFAAALVAVVVLGAVPFVGGLIDGLAAPVRYVIVPLGVAMLGTHAAPDGRSAHRFAWAWVRLQLRSRRRSVGRRVPREGEPVVWDAALPVRADEHAPELKRSRVRGPARVTFASGVGLEQDRERMIAGPHPDGGAVCVALAEGERVEVQR